MDSNVFRSALGRCTFTPTVKPGAVVHTELERYSDGLHSDGYSYVSCGPYNYSKYYGFLCVFVALFVFFDLFDGSNGRGVLRRISRACITYQVDYVRTDDVTRSRRMVLKDIEDFTAMSHCLRQVRRNIGETD